MKSSLHFVWTDIAALNNTPGRKPRTMNPIFYIDAEYPEFPRVPSQNLRGDGCVAVSSVLNSELVQAAYRQGIFPWMKHDRHFYWFTQHPRAVIFPHKLHIGRSLQKILRHRAYRVTVNHAFEDVITHCAAAPRKGQGGTWIGADFIAAYTQLHRQGKAHSVECWYPDRAGCFQLAGGFYGVQLGQVFYGESMFSRQNDASKIAFARAVPYFAQCGIQLIDCQQDTAHMQRFGSELLPLEEFVRLLNQYNDLPLATPIAADTIHVQAAFAV